MSKKKSFFSSDEMSEADKMEADLEAKLAVENEARIAEDGFVAPSPDAPVMDEKSFAAKAGLPHGNWFDVPGAECPVCGFTFQGCHNTHSTIVLAKQIILNGRKFGPGEVILPTEAQALWALGL